MIANAKAVAHGIRAMLYVSGESRNKKHPERITRICDNFMPQGMDATGIWTDMKFATMNHPNIKNNVIRMEISLAMEHTENFTSDDWQQLWNDFAEAFDSQEIRDKDGKVISSRTNISHTASRPYGCTRNPRAAYRTFMPSSAVWTRTGTSTMTMPYTSAHNGRLKRSRGKGAGLPPCTYTRRTFHRSVPTALKPCASLTNGHGTATRKGLPPKATTYICARIRKMSFVDMSFSKATRSSRHRNLERGETLPHHVSGRRGRNCIPAMCGKSPLQPNSLLYQRRSRPFQMVRGKSHSQLYSKVIRYSRTTRTISPTVNQRSLSMTVRPTSVIFRTWCLTSSTMSSTTVNLLIGRTCRTWRWLTSPS